MPFQHTHRFNTGQYFACVDCGILARANKFINSFEKILVDLYRILNYEVFLLCIYSSPFNVDFQIFQL